MSSLKVLRAEPLCAETPLDLHSHRLTPNDEFYVRNNFPIPSAPWPGLLVDGGFANTGLYSLPRLQALPQQDLVATLECAGNGRAFLDPPANGEQWGLGAVATAAWRGPRLRDVVTPAGPPHGTAEILFECADGFARSLPIARALEDDVLLALTMNSEPLPLVHGAPLRLVVGGWYGMASPKWLVRISALAEPFRGYFQTERYVIGDQPVTRVAPRALITSPGVGALVSAYPQVIRGFAWSAEGGARKVEVSDDGGARWLRAHLIDPPSGHAWSRWEFAWTPRRPGPAELLARVHDETGTQPLEPSWNALGYVNNAVVPHPVVVDRT